MTPVFDTYSAYYDLLYRDKDYATEAAHVHRLIQKHCPEARTILELGSGTGRHARWLAEHGYRVRGIERSAAMLAWAQKQAATSSATERLRFEQGDIRNLAGLGKYDAVISLFHVISYITDTADLHKVFSGVTRHLAPQGIFLFDCWYGPAVLWQKPEVRVKRLENEAYRVVRLAEPEMRPQDNMVIVHYEMFVERKSDGCIQHFTEDHPMRYFTVPELAELLAANGLRIVLTEGDLGRGEPPSEQTWGLTVVAQAHTGAL